jgi:hypothetical protein
MYLVSSDSNSQSEASPKHNADGEALQLPGMPTQHPMNAFSHKERLKCFVQTALAKGNAFEETIDVTTFHAKMPRQEFAPTDSVNKNESAFQQYFLRL